MPGNPLHLGKVIGSDGAVTIPAAARAKHVYACGGTGVGKSKFLEHCVRQDILNWNDSKCGLILFDPHGLVCQNILAWLAKHGLKRPIVPIDLRRDDWVVSYNLLRPRKNADPAVVVANFVRALSHVWGAAGTDQTPLFARFATAILLTLYQNGRTLADVTQLLSRDDVRRAMVTKLTDENVRDVWQRAEEYPKDFATQITSTLNRFQRLADASVMKATLGQPGVSLDLLSAMEEGKIILVNLSTEGGQIDDEHADTFATLLLTDLWSAAKSRGKREGEDVKPFYVYIDECQNCVTPTIAKNLEQARGFGLHLTLASQFPTQIINAGPHGKAMYDSILGVAGTKIVFRTEHPDDIKSLAQSLFMSTLDTDQVKLKLLSTKVVGYREEIRESRTTGSSTTTSRTSATGGGRFEGQSDSGGKGGSESFDPEDPDNAGSPNTPDGIVEAWNESVTSSSGESENWSEGESEGETQSSSVTRSHVQVPIMAQEVSSVQYRSVDEQLFKHMQ